jgi:hypothetical protein
LQPPSWADAHHRSRSDTFRPILRSQPIKACIRKQPAITHLPGAHMHPRHPHRIGRFSWTKKHTT